jgi:hypothetical protein
MTFKVSERPDDILRLAYSNELNRAALTVVYPGAGLRVSNSDFSAFLAIRPGSGPGTDRITAIEGIDKNNYTSFIGVGELNTATVSGQVYSAGINIGSGAGSVRVQSNLLLTDNASVIIANTQSGVLYGDGTKQITANPGFKSVSTGTRSPNQLGSMGEICYNETYLYVCVATNKWIRVGYVGLDILNW